MSTVSDFTIDDVRRVLSDVAGASSALDGDISQTSFADLGYDSLALLETTARLQRELSIKLPDDAVLAVRTPAQLIDLVSTARIAS
ncbi:acyl carrier protein [Catellatospora sp. KI3]|uniref:acyl carrier protein n=1 Tax=Catellatospora sp. KI3 TaxID=3041620 RepID=UPI00248262E2|nr:acyl carrier protein [Catellatospora sp. KI3]MDI1463875.1 acyl carrier protein [Catellatospora sp. KI3]